MNVDAIRDAIPYYLTKERAEGFLRELKTYNENTKLITNDQEEYFLQGDGWRGFSMFDLNSSSIVTTRGIIISNSCDISPENKREIPAKVTYVPLVRLSHIEQTLKNSGLKPEAVTARISAIRKQENTSFFYIPNQGILPEDYVAWLSDIHSMPTASFLDDTNANRERLFSLTMVGFYIFVIKLSIHFCRFHENVKRPF